jgi:hypothetical protein
MMKLIAFFLTKGSFHMATATVTTRQERKIVQHLVDVETINLQLSRKEADFLYFVMGCIGGSPTESPRKFSVAIKNALFEHRDSSIDYHRFHTNMLDNGGKSLHFKTSGMVTYGNLLDEEN